MVLITSGFAEHILHDSITFVEWESEETDIDLTPLTNKHVLYCKGTFSQVMELLKICDIYYMDITGFISIAELIILDSIKDGVINIYNVDGGKSDRVRGVITSETTEDMAVRLLKTCSRIWIRNSELTIKSLSRYMSNTRILNITGYTSGLECLSLKKLEISHINPAIISSIGRMDVRKVVITGQRRPFDITPIITNPRIEKLTTNSECTYDPKSKITLLRIKGLPHELHEVCKMNRKLQMLESAKAAI